MITMSRLKQLIAAASLLVGLVGGAVVIRQAGGAVLRASQGADPASAFHATVTSADDIRAVVAWEPDPALGGRPMEPTTRIEITAAYAAAWAALDRAGQGDPAAPLDTYLGGGALERGRHLAAGTTRSITQHLAHRLVLRFYSDDGAVAAIEVPSMSVVRTIGTGVDAIVSSSVEQLRVVMVLEDGNWRVHLLERTP